MSAVAWQTSEEAFSVLLAMQTPICKARQMGLPIIMARPFGFAALSTEAHVTPNYESDIAP